MYIVDIVGSGCTVRSELGDEGETPLRVPASAWLCRLKVRISRTPKHAGAARRNRRCHKAARRITSPRPENGAREVTKRVSNRCTLSEQCRARALAHRVGMGRQPWAMADAPLRWSTARAPTRAVPRSCEVARGTPREAGNQKAHSHDIHLGDAAPQQAFRREEPLALPAFGRPRPVLARRARRVGSARRLVTAGVSSCASCASSGAVCCVCASVWGPIGGNDAVACVTEPGAVARYRKTEANPDRSRRATPRHARTHLRGPSHDTSNVSPTTRLAVLSGLARLLRHAPRCLGALPSVSKHSYGFMELISSLTGLHGLSAEPTEVCC